MMWSSGKRLRLAGARVERMKVRCEYGASVMGIGLGVILCGKKSMLLTRHFSVRADMVEVYWMHNPRQVM